MRLGTQQDLLGALEGGGCRVTQATISRDIRELGLVEDRTIRSAGCATCCRTASSEPTRATRSTRCCASSAGGATAAENIVVVQSEIGSAPAIARALDRLEHPLILGTLAGDDTCLSSRATRREPAGSRTSSPPRSAECRAAAVEARAPRVRSLELRRKPEEQRFAGRRADQLDADGQAVDDVERHRRRGLAGHVDDRRERRELPAAGELHPRIVGREDPADRHRQLREAPA